MAPLRSRKACVRLKGVGFVYVGFGTVPNWVARTVPDRVSASCRREFVRAFAAVRREFDLIPPDDALHQELSLSHAEHVCFQE